MKFKSEYYWFLIFAFSFTAFNQIQDYIRPNYIGDNSIVKYLLGVAPNFFPAIGIPALFVVIDKNNKKVQLSITYNFRNSLEIES